MPRLQCPRCETTIEAPTQGQPVCPACGFTAPYQGSGEDQEQGEAGYQEERPPSDPGPSDHEQYEAESRPDSTQQEDPGQGYGSGYGGYQEGYAPQGYGIYSQPYGSQGPGPSSQGYGGPPGGAPPGHPGGPQAQGPYAGPQHGPPGKTSGMAVASMILGIIAICLIFIAWIPVIGWFSFGPAVVAIILGAVALSQMNKDPTLQGRGMAVAGLVLGIIVAAIGFVFRVMFMGL